MKLRVLLISGFIFVVEHCEGVEGCEAAFGYLYLYLHFNVHFHIERVSLSFDDGHVRKAV